MRFIRGPSRRDRPTSKVHFTVSRLIIIPKIALLSVEMSSQFREESWVSIGAASESLQIGQATLHRLKDHQLLEPGTHWLRTTPGKTSKILWNPNKIREAMAAWSKPNQQQATIPM